MFFDLCMSLFLCLRQNKTFATQVQAKEKHNLSLNIPVQKTIWLQYLKYIIDNSDDRLSPVFTKMSKMYKLWAKMFWYQVNLWTLLCLNTVIMTAAGGWAGFISGCHALFEPKHRNKVYELRVGVQVSKLLPSTVRLHWSWWIYSMSFGGFISVFWV